MAERRRPSVGDRRLTGPVRLQKFLARAGVASRRKSEEIIAAGRVRVDGRIVSEVGSTVDPDQQRVEVDGREVHLSPARWIALHKPPAFLCTRADPAGRPTIYDLLSESDAELFHVGRLDYLSEGLLLLTNEGGVAHRLLHPSHELIRRYLVGVLGPVDPALPTRLLAGVRLEDGPARATRAAWSGALAGREPVLSLSLAEGRNREIRRMLAAMDVKIRWLRRIAFGPIALGALPRGEVRELEAAEVHALRSEADRKLDARAT